MVTRWPNAFLASTTLHGVAIGCVLLLGYSIVQQSPPPPSSPVIQWVDGPTSAARDAGSSPSALAPPSVRFTAPPVVHPKPPSASVANEREDDAPRVSPSPVLPVKPAGATTRDVTVASRSARSDQRTGPRMTSADYRQRHDQAERSNVAPHPVQHIDVTEVTRGLRTAATGNAGELSVAALSEAEAYLGRLERALRERLEREPGLDDGLSAEVEFRIDADGRLTAARLLKRSPDERFNTAVLEAVATTTLPPRPPGVDEIQKLPIVTHARR